MMVTVAPPVVMRLPTLSLAVTVKTWGVVPLAVIVAEVGAKIDCVASSATPT